MVLLSGLFLTSCSKETDDIIIANVEHSVFVGAFNRDCATPPPTRSGLIWHLDGFRLLHTRGLEIMALSGNVNVLYDEYCEKPQRGGTIPAGLGDDPHGQGYASRITFGNWIVAMYHPVAIHGADHWIMYRKSDGYWERWDLGVRSQSAQPEDGIPYLWTKKQGTSVPQTNS